MPNGLKRCFANTAELMTFLQRLVPLTSAASPIAVGVVVSANRQLDHRLPEQTLAAPEPLPDLLPRIVCGKVVGIAKVRQTVAERGYVIDLQGHGRSVRGVEVDM